MHTNYNYLRWSQDPVIFTLGFLEVRWYGLIFAAAFFLGYCIMRGIYRREHKSLLDLDELFLYAMVGTVIGARLGHCLFYEPRFYLSHPLEILKIWHGGLASHGGLIGLCSAIYLYSRGKRDQSFLWLLSRMSIPSALGGALVRLGNFFNSEIIGVPTRLPWAIVFTRIDNVPRHPAQLYESISYLAVFALLLAVYHRYGRECGTRLLLGLYFLLVFSFRFLLEFLKEPQSPFEKGLVIDMGQILSIPLIVLGLFLLLKARGETPGRRGNRGRKTG